MKSQIGLYFSFLTKLYDWVTWILFIEDFQKERVLVFSELVYNYSGKDWEIINVNIEYDKWNGRLKRHAKATHGAKKTLSSNKIKFI